MSIQLVPAKNLPETRILKRNDITPMHMSLWIERPGGFTFKPGQFCTLGLDGIERAYSIVSAPHETELELFIELVPLPHGILTPKLWRLEEGDKLTIRPKAKGIFVFKDDKPNQVMVATVTGVVPYISILRDYLYKKRSGHHFYVIFGASYVEELGFHSELSHMQQDHPEMITYVPTISRPKVERNKGWTGLTGRANQVLPKLITKWGLNQEDTLIYVCGHPGCIMGVKQNMIPVGFEVEEERYWKDD